MEAFIDDYDKLHSSLGDSTEGGDRRNNDREELQKFEKFVVYANANEEKVKAALKELEKQKKDMDETPVNTHIVTRMVTLDGRIRGFPTSVKDRRRPKKIWDFYTPEDLPPIVVSGDIDSVYTFDHSLSRLVRACGNKTRWVMPNITRRESADTGSRFCVNSDLCEAKPFIRGGRG